MSREKITSVLAKYLPHPAVETCTSWIIQKNIHLKLTKGRSSKFGDYMPLPSGKGHRITVNHDLNSFAFLITFVHEVAHLEAYNKFHHRHEPHGKEWKTEFRELLSSFILNGIFPEDIRSALSIYISDPAASSCTDHNLFRVLKKYDDQSAGIIFLEDLPDNSLFMMHQSRSGQVFKKGHKIRKRL